MFSTSSPLPQNKKNYESTFLEVLIQRERKTQAPLSLPLMYMWPYLLPSPQLSKYYIVEGSVCMCRFPFCRNLQHKKYYKLFHYFLMDFTQSAFGKAIKKYKLQPNVQILCLILVILRILVLFFFFLCLISSVYMSIQRTFFTVNWAKVKHIFSHNADSVYLQRSEGRKLFQHRI